MSFHGWLQIILFAAAILVLTKPLGSYLFRIFESDRQPLPRLLGPLERGIYRLCGVDAAGPQGWQEYTWAVLLFSAFGIAVTYAIQRWQHLLPLNPQGLPAVTADLALNTAVSFATNTNWQSYAGESTMSYFTQMAGLAWHNFTSAAAGIAVAVALARGLTRHLQPGITPTLGNFWVDLTRALLYVLLPICIPVGLLFVALGLIQTFAPYTELTTLDGAQQLLAMGPVASQEVIKQLGTNGGGFFNANAAHPFENPTPVTNLISMLLIFAIPAALTYTFGRMAGNQKQGWTLFAAMALLFLVGVTTTYWAEAGGNPAARPSAIDQSSGNMEGKEVRFGVAASALYATITTATSCGAVNSMHDSFTPIGGLVPLVNMQLGEVIFGGVGAGLYGMLIFALLTVFIAGLMVGRTPEYLGKKVEAREIKLAMLYTLVFPFIVLVGTAWSAVMPYATSSLNNAGPHGLTEMLYAYSSGAGNNGSAFAGLNANTPWWNVSLAVTMLAGRFLMMVPILAIAGSMAGKRVVPPSLGSFPTDGGLYVLLLVGVIIVIGALTFLPALSLGPIVEHFLARGGKLF